jgi:hypothetical protein
MDMAMAMAMAMALALALALTAANFELIKTILLWPQIILMLICALC